MADKRRHERLAYERALDDFFGHMTRNEKIDRKRTKYALRASLRGHELPVKHKKNTKPHGQKLIRQDTQKRENALFR